ncbi:MAG: 5'-nucleotidase, lipoprotein e(P4) family [Bacteroidetes bacterium]|nr:5'-nucleotidase, lipoprotein e(P4) family [Bacteroidota bacterium]MBU1579112.1 5'-nucleotidase, lipoprotein e(P4) family [Bacteroidota bacterium]MBU2465765.1 5'-nucleotidase, lipoprotein e(P4) family [Bacteroidota bacterium]MBU2558934.1 5'-nucleotidase, lipoprotein e(P4) family [Bacteroidota bacterium]
MKIKLIGLLVFLFILASCEGPNQHHHAPAHGTHPALYATLYQQQAAEYKALCYQAFNIAAERLDSRLQSPTDNLLAVVVDIDETVLDNSPYQAQGILDHFGYPEKWDEWINAAKAEPVPGALEFLKYASEKGVAVFYISNRKEKLRESTLKNLQELGFPDAANEQLLLRTTENDKEPRRQQVLATYEIVLLMGDNLGDFHSTFDTSDAAVRDSFTTKNISNFGKKWIVLPNAVYGSWMNVLPGMDEARKTHDNSYLEQGLKGF